MTASQSAMPLATEPGGADSSTVRPRGSVAPGNITAVSGAAVPPSQATSLVMEPSIPMVGVRDGAKKMSVPQQSLARLEKHREFLRFWEGTAPLTRGPASIVRLNRGALHSFSPYIEAHKQRSTACAFRFWKFPLLRMKSGLMKASFPIGASTSQRVGKRKHR